MYCRSLFWQLELNAITRTQLLVELSGQVEVCGGSYHCVEALIKARADVRAKAGGASNFGVLLQLRRRVLFEVGCCSLVMGVAAAIALSSEGMYSMGLGLVRRGRTWVYRALRGIVG